VCLPSILFCRDSGTPSAAEAVTSGGAKGGPAGARAPAVKPCAPAVPRQLSYCDVDHKRISCLRATDYSEDINYIRCYQSR